MLRFIRTRQPSEESDVTMRNLNDNKTVKGRAIPITKEESGRIRHQSLAADKEVTTIKEAIAVSDFTRLKSLLECGRPIGDNLFYAISQGSLNAVRIICSFLRLRKGEEELHVIVNRTPKGIEYIPSSTPLQIAAKHNDLEIVKVLIRHGAVMPKLEKCLELAGSDIIVRSLVFLLYMRAVSSPALLIAKEVNPVGRALRIAFNLEDNGFINETNEWFVNHQSFKDSLKDIRETIEGFLCDILSHCKNRFEVDTILEIQANHRFDDEDEEDSDGILPKMLNIWEDSALPPGLEQAIALNFRKYVSHPYAQMVLIERALSGPVKWEKMSQFRFAVMSIFLVMISPVLCFSYAFCPFPRLVRLMQTPYVRVLNTFSSHMIFLLFLILSAVNLTFVPVECPDEPHMKPGNETCVKVGHRFWPITARMMIMSLIILGEAMWLVYSLYRMGLRMFTRQVWTWINIIQTSFFFISLAAYVITMFQIGADKVRVIFVDNSTTSDVTPGIPKNPPRRFNHQSQLFETSRAEWQLFDSVLVAELAFAIGNVLTVLRLLYTLILVEFLGPLVISLSRMLLTVGRFLIVSVLILVSFALGLTQLFAPYQTLMPCTDDVDEEESLCGQTEMFSSFRSSLLTLFWSIFGDFAITRMSLPHNLKLITYSGHIMHATFVIIMTIVVLNMLIATILNVYESIQGNLDQEWKFARTKLLEEYFGQRGNLPAPYNLLPSVRFFWKCLRFCCHFVNKKFRQTKGKLLKSESSAEYEWSRHYHQPKADDDTTPVSYKNKHKIVKAVVGRYMNNAYPAIDCTMEHVEGIEQIPTGNNVTARRSSSVYNEFGYSSRQSSAKRGRHQNASTIVGGSTTSIDSIEPAFCFRPIAEDDEMPPWPSSLPQFSPLADSTDSQENWKHGRSFSLMSLSDDTKKQERSVSLV